MTLQIFRVLLGAAAALAIWHFIVMSHILELVRQGAISILTFGIPFFAPLTLLAAALAAKRHPRTARILFILAAALGLAATSVLPVFWQRYVPIPILAFLGLVAAEIHHSASRTTNES
ncbi:MAG: hypothetical protein EBS65_06845 [Betaproteobacteria bacterium]|nr:hypothetical protein [Betaproteobacteria bacterium]